MQDKLSQLKKMSIVVADSGDINAIKAFAPQDCTTNPSLILKAAQQKEYAPFVLAALKEGMNSQENGMAKLEMVVDRLAVAFGRELAMIVPGMVSTEVEAHLSFDSQAMIAKAHRLIQLYADKGIDKKRILIKLAATWGGIQAARVLEEEGIHCNMTLIFCQEQALACAQAGAYLISPFVGRITDWYKKAQAVEYFPIDQDPGVLSVKTIYQQLKAEGFSTIVMGASFRTTAQIEALAGCDRLTISPALLNELQDQKDRIARQLSPEFVGKGKGTIPLSEQAFCWALNQNPMAHEKLAEGIRLFHQDYVKLLEFIQNFANTHAIKL